MSEFEYSPNREMEIESKRMMLKSAFHEYISRRLQEGADVHDLDWGNSDPDLERAVADARLVDMSDPSNAFAFIDEAWDDTIQGYIHRAKKKK